MRGGRAPAAGDDGGLAAQRDVALGLAVVLVDAHRVVAPDNGVALVHARVALLEPDRHRLDESEALAWLALGLGLELGLGIGLGLGLRLGLGLGLGKP